MAGPKGSLVSAAEKAESSSKAEKMSLPFSSKAEKSTASAKAEKVASEKAASMLTPSAADAVAKSASTKAEKSTASAKSGKGEKTVDV